MKAAGLDMNAAEFFELIGTPVCLVMDGHVIFAQWDDSLD